jgi:thioesterase domain-containing protein
VVPFIGLSALLGDDRPVYALEDPGLQGGAVEPRELAGIAADYLAVVREVEPEGPLHLGGWSAGGLVALEMARQDGDAATVLLLDTRLPDASPDPDDDQLRSWFTADIAGMGVDLGESELAERLPVFAENVRAFLRHRPSPVSTRVVLLRAQESASAYLSRRYADADAVHPVPGNHYTMLQPPHVEPLAQVVRERLSEVRVR